MDVAIDYLEVWHAPVGEQLRPWDVAAFLPYSKQGDSVIYLGRSSIVADPIGRTAALGDRRSRTDLRRRIPGGTPEAWVGGRPQHSDRYSLGGG
jgi:hypothetical protein